MMAGTPMRIDFSALPSVRRGRDVLVVLGFVSVLVILFALLWLPGPLPRLLPLMCSGACPMPPLVP